MRKTLPPGVCRRRCWPLNQDSLGLLFTEGISAISQAVYVVWLPITKNFVADNRVRFSRGYLRCNIHITLCSVPICLKRVRILHTPTRLRWYMSANCQDCIYVLVSRPNDPCPWVFHLQINFVYQLKMSLVTHPPAMAPVAIISSWQFKKCARPYPPMIQSLLIKASKLFPSFEQWL